MDYLGNDEVEVPMRNLDDDDTPQIFKITGAKLSEAFQKYAPHMRFTIANGKLEDVDLGADVANLICQVATYGEVIFA